MARPKGYADWAPKAETLDLIQLIQGVLEEYQAHLPLTVRQIFYRLVGQHGYEKTERAYSRLCEHLVRARRAGMISFSAIRDDGTMGGGGGGYEGVADFWEIVRSDAESYERNHLENQRITIELWCEAGGMVPQLQRVARPYDVPVYSTGGFSSVTVTHQIAARAGREERPTVFLHVGDFDPSGESIFEAMGTDALCFLRGQLASRPEYDGVEVLNIRDPLPEGPDLRLRRVALTADQVEEYDLPTAPPKSSDTRSVNWVGETCQAEAMPPDLLAEIVENAISELIDHDVLQAVVEKEEQERATIQSQLELLIEESR